LQSEYARWFEALSDPLHDTATGEALQAIVDLELDDLLAIQPPQRIQARLNAAQPKRICMIHFPAEMSRYRFARIPEL
jgi:hypothetical protein